MFYCVNFVPSYIHIACDHLPVCAVVLVVRGSRPGKNVQLSENEIRGLCLKSREIFLSQPILLELEAPLKICGLCLSDYANDSLQDNKLYEFFRIIL